MESQLIGSSAGGTEGWDDQEWEDFTQMPAPAQPSAKRSTTSTGSTQSVSKPLKLETTRTPSPTLFEDVTSWTSTTSATRKGKTSSPPPVPPGLFAVQEKSGGGGGNGGWGDWGDEDIGSTAEIKKVGLCGHL